MKDGEWSSVNRWVVECCAEQPEEPEPLFQVDTPENAAQVARIHNHLLTERDAAVAESARVREALQAVRELHHRSVDATGLVYCEWCDENVKGYGQGDLWPCETVRALDAALDGEIND